jgi:hypothetical protein
LVEREPLLFLLRRERREGIEGVEGRERVEERRRGIGEAYFRAIFTG